MAGQQEMDREFHGLYGGSGIHRLLAGCYGSARLGLTVPKPPPTKWQEDGTAAHADLEQRIKTKSRDVDGPVGMALSYIVSIVNSAPRASVWSEQRVYFPQSLVPAEQASGTLDAAIWDGGRRAWILDYKHGAGEYVEAEENAQLLFYAWAFLHDKLAWIDEVVLAIVQPNCSMGAPIREWSVGVLELFEFAQRATYAIEQAERLHAPLLAGEHCRFCAAGPVCPIREADALAVMTGAPEGSVKGWVPNLPPPQEIDLGRLGAIVTKADEIRAWLKATEEYAERRALAGEISVPGCKVVEAPARRRFEGDETLAAGRLLALANGLLAPKGEHSGLDRFFPRKLVGITEAERQIVDAASRGIVDATEKRRAIEAAKQAFSALTVKDTSGALSLVPLSDPRPPVNRAAKHFGGVVVKGLDE